MYIYIISRIQREKGRSGETRFDTAWGFLKSESHNPLAQQTGPSIAGLLVKNMARLTRSFLTTGGMMMGRLADLSLSSFHHHQHLSRDSQHMFTPLDWKKTSKTKDLLGWGKKRHRTHLLQTSGWCQRLPQNVCPLRFSPHNSHTRSGNQAAMNSLLLFQIIKLFVSAGVVHLAGFQRYVLCWRLRCLSYWTTRVSAIYRSRNENLPGFWCKNMLTKETPNVMVYHEHLLKSTIFEHQKKYPIHWIGEFLWGNVVPYNKKKIVCHPINSTNHAVFHCKLRQGLDTRKSKIKVQIFDASGFRILAPSKQPLLSYHQETGSLFKGIFYNGSCGSVNYQLNSFDHIVRPKKSCLVIVQSLNKGGSWCLMLESPRWAIGTQAWMKCHQKGISGRTDCFFLVEGAGGVGNVWISKNSAGSKESFLNEILFRVRIQRSWKRLFKRLLTSGSVIRDDFVLCFFFKILIGGGAGNQKLRTQTPPAAFPVRSLLSSGRLKSRS